MLQQLPLRQRIRKALVIIAFLSFPITMNYLSPYVILEASAGGIVNGSLIMFGLMFVSSLFLSHCILDGTVYDHQPLDPQSL